MKFRVHPLPRKRNLPTNAAATNKKLRRAPHVFERVLELPVRSDTDVLVQEYPDCYKFKAEAENIGGDVSTEMIEMLPGVTKIGVRANGVLLVDDFDLDLWRFRLPETTRPELTSAVCVDGELVVTVPKDVADGWFVVVK